MRHAKNTLECYNLWKENIAIWDHGKDIMLRNISWHCPIYRWFNWVDVIKYYNGTQHFYRFMKDFLTHQTGDKNDMG